MLAARWCRRCGAETGHEGWSFDLGGAALLTLASGGVAAPCWAALAALNESLPR